MKSNISHFPDGDNHWLAPSSTVLLRNFPFILLLWTSSPSRGDLLASHQITEGLSPPLHSNVRCHTYGFSGSCNGSSGKATGAEICRQRLGHELPLSWESLLVLGSWFWSCDGVNAALIECCWESDLAPVCNNGTDRNPECVLYFLCLYF